MATVTDIGTLIEQTPEICGGRPRIAGTGISVRRIAGWYKLGQNAEEIATQIPHLTLAQVHAALAYYLANQATMDAEMAAEQAEADRLEREHAAARRKYSRRAGSTALPGRSKTIQTSRRSCGLAERSAWPIGPTPRSSRTEFIPLIPTTFDFSLNPEVHLRQRPLGHLTASVRSALCRPVSADRAARAVRVLGHDRVLSRTNPRLDCLNR